MTPETPPTPAAAPTPQPSNQELQRKLYLRALTAFSVCYRNSKIYTPKHPSCLASINQFLDVTREIFKSKIELFIQHTEGLFVIEDFFFIEESLLFFDLLVTLEKLKIGSVVILPQATAEEMTELLSFIVAKPSETEPEKSFVTNGVQALVEEKSFINLKEKGARVHNAANQYNEWCDKIEQIFLKLVEDQNFSLAEVTKPLDLLLDSLEQDPAIFSFTLQKPKVSNPQIHHALDTMILSIFMGQQLNFESSALKLLALTALFHDVGRLFLPSEFTTHYKLKGQDAELVQIHAGDGALYLSGVPGLPLLISRVALEHHIGYDGQGYPQLPATHKPHLFSQIVGLADFISWGTLSDNVYHRPQSVGRVLSSVIRRAGTQFSPVLVKIVLPFFGLFPPSGLVKISNGATACVVEPNMRNITRPGLAVAGSRPASGERAKLKFAWIASASNNTPKSFDFSIEKILRYVESEDSISDVIPDYTGQP